MPQRSRAAGILVLLGGAFLLSGGFACLFIYLLLPLTYRGPDLLATNLTVASLAAIGLVFGLILTHQARNFLRARPSAMFRPPSPWRLVAVFVAAAIVGQVILYAAPSSPLTFWVFPPLHIAAAMTPALAILALVGTRLQAASWRTVSLELSHGALLAPAIALTAELVAIVGVVVVVSMVVTLAPGGLDTLLDLSGKLQDPSWLENPKNLAGLVLSPAGLTILIAVFVFFAPLIEEFVKGLGVLLLGRRLRTQAQALLWGVACGAGFTLGESLFNGSLALEGWGLVMLVRWGASLMHCAASGMMGLGWYGALSNKRPWPLLLAYAASTGAHALWNALAVAVAVPSLLVLSRPDDASIRTVAGLTIAGATGLLLLLTISMTVLLARLITRAHDGSLSQTPMEGEPSSDSGAA